MTVEAQWRKPTIVRAICALALLVAAETAYAQTSPSASPATGSAKAHEMEQKTILTLAFEMKG